MGLRDRDLAPVVAGLAVPAVAAGFLHALDDGPGWTAVAVVQVAWVALVLAEPGRGLLALGVVAHGSAAVAGVVSGGTGTPAGALAVGFDVVVAAAAVLGASSHWARVRPAGVAAIGLLVAAVAVPAAAARDHGPSSTAEPAAGRAAAPAAAHAHGAHGDPGTIRRATADERLAADELLAETRGALWQWLDDERVSQAGFRPTIGSLRGYDHLVNWAWIDDDVVLDPDHPESLVYRVAPDGRRTLEAAMFVLPAGAPDEEVPDVGGPLTQWHRHDNLCFGRARTVDGALQRDLKGVTPVPGRCPAGQSIALDSPMLHVWAVPQRCGPFAALEGEGAGRAVAEAIDPGAATGCAGAAGQ